MNAGGKRSVAAFRRKNENSHPDQAFNEKEEEPREPQPFQPNLES